MSDTRPLTAFLFPGQGTALDGLDRRSLARPGPLADLIACASSALGLDLLRALSARDPIVTKTEIAQPATVAITLGWALERVAAGGVADVTAGHSLGELTAVAFAGCLSPEQAIAAAVVRGRLMAAAAARAPGGMAAVRCSDQATVHRLLAEGRQHGALEIAAHNAPAQWVLTGDKAALGAVAAHAPTTTLPVTGPWHSRAMADAALAWQDALTTLSWRPPVRTLVLAATAKAAPPIAELPAALAAALLRPVLWLATMQALAAAGVGHFVALEPGRVLRGFCREILGVTCEAAAG